MVIGATGRILESARTDAKGSAPGPAETYPRAVTTSDAPATRLLLVRHGESEVTVRRVIGGPRTCSGLSELGRRQAVALGDRLRRQPVAVDHVVSSQYPRAIETAEALRPALGDVADHIRRLPGWGEHDPGPDIDGMTFTAYVERFGTPDWAGDPDAVIFPGGETTRQFHERVRAALDDLLDTHAGRTTMVVCHGGVVDAVFRRLLRIAPTGGFELHTLNTSITEFVATNTGGWRLVRYNDAAHLAGLPEATPRGDAADAGEGTDRIVASSGADGAA